jgi:ABC-2 type transport system permease protein
VSARLEDVRYTRYEGELRGRTERLGSLVWFGARTALGARRGWKAKIIPFSLIAIAAFPAIVVLGLKALLGSRIQETIPEILPYNDYYSEIGVVVMLFAGLVGPELLCPDRRDNVLSLYFSTALERHEYVIGRIAGTVAPMLLVTLVPQLTLFFGNTVFADEPIDYLRDEVRALGAIVVAGFVLALYFSLLSLAVASLSARRAFAMGGYIGLIVLTGAVGGTLAFGIEVGEGWSLLQLLVVPIIAVRTMFSSNDIGDTGPPLAEPWYWLVTAAVCVGSLVVLWWRYRGDEG